jgi:hypothetical protein
MLIWTMLETVTNSWALILRISSKLVIGFKEECGATTETAAGSDSDEIETAAAGDGLNKSSTSILLLIIRSVQAVGGEEAVCTRSFFIFQSLLEHQDLILLSD